MIFRDERETFGQPVFSASSPLESGSCIVFSFSENGETVRDLETLAQAQTEVAEAYIRQLDEARVFDAPIVTEVVPLDRFYEAEAYHQNYAALHPAQPYIAFTSTPKVSKLRKYFADRLKA